MAEDLEAEDKPCCASLKTKCLKLRTKCVNLEERKNQFRNAANLVQKQYDAIEQQNATLKQALEDLEVQVSRWKDEKEKETGIRVDLEDEVSALKEEIQLLKQNGRSGPGEADGKHQEMNRMKDLFEKEKGRADLEKKNAEMQRKKADDALKKLEKEKKKASEAQGVANTEKKNAEKNRILLEKLKNENDALKSEMASEGSKSEAADEKLQAEKQETIKARQLAEMNMKKAEDYKLRWEKVKLELDALKSMLTSERLKSEAAEKKVVAEKQETINARKLAEMNMKKAEDYKLHLEKMKTEFNGVKSMLTSERLKSEAAEKKLEAEKQETIKSRELAEMNMKKSEDYKPHLEKMKSELNGVKSMLTSERLKSEAAKKKLEVEKQNTSREKNRADDLTKKLEQESTRAKELEEGFCGHVCSKKLVEAHAATPGAAKSKQLANNISEGTADDDAHSSQMIKMLLEKDQNVSKEKSRADSETKKAKKLQKAAKEHKMRALQEKYRADLLSKELEGYKLRLKQLGKEQQEFLAYDIFADNSQRCDNIYESETMKLLKNQLKLEKMLTKHAKEATKLEVFRNNMLHQELLLLKKECLRFQQRLDMLDDSFLNDSEGIHGLEKVGNQIFSRDKFYPDELLASVLHL